MLLIKRLDLNILKFMLEIFILMLIIKGIIKIKIDNKYCFKLKKVILENFNVLIKIMYFLKY